jgi:hypothetical protein
MLFPELKGSKLLAGKVVFDALFKGLKDVYCFEQGIIFDGNRTINLKE